MVRLCCFQNQGKSGEGRRTKGGGRAEEGFKRMHACSSHQLLQHSDAVETVNDYVIEAMVKGDEDVNDDERGTRRRTWRRTLRRTPAAHSERHNQAAQSGGALMLWRPRPALGWTTTYPHAHTHNMHVLGTQEGRLTFVKKGPEHAAGARVEHSSGAHCGANGRRTRLGDDVTR